MSLIWLNISCYPRLDYSLPVYRTESDVLAVVVLVTVTIFVCPQFVSRLFAFFIYTRFVCSFVRFFPRTVRERGCPTENETASPIEWRRPKNVSEAMELSKKHRSAFLFGGIVIFHRGTWSH